MAKIARKRKNPRVRIKQMSYNNFADSYDIFTQASKEQKPPLPTVSEEISMIKDRNSRVEKEKAWETSIERRVIITILTYVVASAWLLIIKDTNPWLKSLVPALGYFLSTLSLSFAKNFWVNRIERSKVKKENSSSPPPLV